MRWSKSAWEDRLSVWLNFSWPHSRIFKDIFSSMERRFNKAVKLAAKLAGDGN
jgi:hypothetical protein